MADELGKIAADLFRAKEMKSEMNKELSLLNTEIKEIEVQLLDAMKACDPPILKLGNEYGTVYVSTQTVPKVINWDAFYEHIRKNNAFEMLERRPSRAAFRELHEQGLAIPGIDPVTFDEVRTRKS